MSGCADGATPVWFEAAAVFEPCVYAFDLVAACVRLLPGRSSVGDVLRRVELGEVRVANPSQQNSLLIVAARK